MVVLSNCTFENRKINTHICFEDLDIHIQDTLRNLPIDTLDCYPDLIDLTGHYKLIAEEIGPWTYAQKLRKNWKIVKLENLIGSIIIPQDLLLLRQKKLYSLWNIIL